MKPSERIQELAISHPLYADSINRDDYSQLRITAIIQYLDEQHDKSINLHIEGFEKGKPSVCDDIEFDEQAKKAPCSKQKRPPRLLLREGPLGPCHRGGTFKSSTGRHPDPFKSCNAQSKGLIKAAGRANPC